MEEPNVQVKVPPFCDKHEYKVVHEAKYTKGDPWQALLIVANAAMFQGAACSSTLKKKSGGDIKYLETIGCLGCCLPQKMEEVLKECRTGIVVGNTIGRIKELGERWVAEENQRNKKDE